MASVGHWNHRSDGPLIMLTAKTASTATPAVPALR